MSKDENEDELAEILRDKEFLNEQYDVLVSRYAALELDLDELKNEKEVESIKSAKYEELIKQQESDMEILRSQVLYFMRKAKLDILFLTTLNGVPTKGKLSKNAVGKFWQNFNTFPIRSRRRNGKRRNRPKQLARHNKTRKMLLRRKPIVN